MPDPSTANISPTFCVGGEGELKTERPVTPGSESLAVPPHVQNLFVKIYRDPQVFYRWKRAQNQPAKEATHATNR